MVRYNPLSWFDSPEKTKKLLIEQAIYHLNQALKICKEYESSEIIDQKKWRQDVEIVTECSWNAGKKIEECGISREPGKKDVYISISRGKDHFKASKFGKAQEEFNSVKERLDYVLRTN